MRTITIMLLALSGCGTTYDSDAAEGNGNDTDGEGDTDTDEPKPDDPTATDVTPRALLNSLPLEGVAVSAFALSRDEEGNVIREDYLASGWSEQEFDVASGDVRFYIGDPKVNGWTEDGYLTARYEGMQYVAVPVDQELKSGGSAEPELTVQLLVGEKYYEHVDAECWELNTGREHEVEYSKGTDWQDGWDISDPWIYQQGATKLVLENDDLMEVPFGFLQPGEWLEVEGDTLVLKPDGVTNLIRDVRVSDDDFSFVYIDAPRDCWWEVSARAW